jgi:hypothetical protein
VLNFPVLLQVPWKVSGVNEFNSYKYFSDDNCIFYFSTITQLNWHVFSYFEKHHAGWRRNHIQLVYAYTWAKRHQWQSHVLSFKLLYANVLIWDYIITIVLYHFQLFSLDWNIMWVDIYVKCTYIYMIKFW